MSEKPMHQKTPAELAALGWRHGRFRDGYCRTVSGDLSPDDLADFKWLAGEMGEEYVHLAALDEWQPPWVERLRSAAKKDTTR